MLTRLVAALMFLVCGLSWAGAQEIITGQPLIGSTATAAEPDLTGDPADDGGFHILVIGDGLGGGLGAGLMRMVELEDGFDVTLRFNEESGVARPEVYDWSETLPKILDGKTYDAVVVLLGANDRQMIRTDIMRFAFNTPEWIAAYKAQTDRILDALLAGGSKIYWVSLPPMADPDYEAAMRAVLLIQKERVAAKGASYVDIRKAFLNADGTYTDEGPDETGAVRKLRGRDGVSFFKQGNNRMAQLVLAAIKQGGTDLPVPAQPATAKVDRQEPAPAAEPETPMFGQSGSDGADVAFLPGDAGVAAVAGLAALQALSAPGSSAERLFVSGDSGKAPIGRADDFSLPK